jgi:uncharacterized protein
VYDAKRLSERNGAGRQVARELLDSAALRNVRIEPTESGDRYDPAAKAVRLSADNFNGRSLTAIAVAAHEVGHALQDARGFRPLLYRIIDSAVGERPNQLSSRMRGQAPKQQRLLQSVQRFAGLSVGLSS